MQISFSSSLFWLPRISLLEGITARFWPPGISFLAANPVKTPTETSPRNCPPRFPYLAAISPRDLGAFWQPRFPYLAAISLQHLAAYLPAEISILGENRGEIAARFWPPRFPASRRQSRRDRGEFLAAEISRISPWSRRDLASILRRNLGAVPRSRRDGEISAAKNAPRYLGEIS